MAWGLIAAAFVGAVVRTWGPAVFADPGSSGQAFAESTLVGVATGTIVTTGAAVIAVCLAWQAWRALGSDHRVVGQGPADRGQG